MATTGELRAIIEELQLVDIGDAATYLGEEAVVEEVLSVSVQSAALPISIDAERLSAPIELPYDCATMK
jgi:hypothetical protein